MPMLADIEGWVLNLGFDDEVEDEEVEEMDT